MYYYTKCVLLKTGCATLKRKVCNIKFLRYMSKIQIIHHFMQNCSRSIENYCFKHKKHCQLQGALLLDSPPAGFAPGLLLGALPPDRHYRLELPSSPCVYYLKILRIGPVINTVQNSSHNFPSYPPDNQHCSDIIY